MSTTVPNYRWSVDNFLSAWDAGAFDGRVELIEGEIWPVVIGDWDGETVFRLGRLLPTFGRITGSHIPVPYAGTEILVDDLLGPL